MPLPNIRVHITPETNDKLKKAGLELTDISITRNQNTFSIIIDELDNKHLLNQANLDLVLKYVPVLEEKTGLQTILSNLPLNQLLDSLKQNLQNVETEGLYALKEKIDENLRKDLFWLTLQQDGLMLQYAPEWIKNNIEFVLTAVKQNGLALQFANENLKDKDFVVEAAVRQNGSSIEFASPRLQKNSTILFASTGINWDMCSLKLKAIINTLNELGLLNKTNLETILKPINRRYLKSFNQVLQANYFKEKKVSLNKEIITILSTLPKSLVLIAMQHNGLLLKYAPERIKNDADAVLAAVKQNGSAIEFASPKLQKDPTILFAATGINYEECSPTLQSIINKLKSLGLLNKKNLDTILEHKNDSELVIFDIFLKKSANPEDAISLAEFGELLNKRQLQNLLFIMIQLNGLALKVAPIKFKEDRDLVLAGVRQNGLALEYASEKLKEDRDLVLAAIQQNGSAIEFASPELQKDSELLFTATGINYEKCSPKLQSIINKLKSLGLLNKKNLDTILNYKEDAHLNCFIAVLNEPPINRDKPYFAELTDTINNTQLQEDLFFITIQCNGLALKVAPEKFKDDYDCVFAAVKQNGLALEYADDKFKINHLIVEEAVAQNGMALEFASKELDHDKDITPAAIEQNPMALQFAPEQFKNNQELVMKAVTQKPSALNFASTDLKNNKEFMLEILKQQPSALQFISPELLNDRAFMLKAILEHEKPEELFISNNEDSILLDLSKLNRDQRQIFAHLLPLTIKLKLETNPRRKHILQTMVQEIEQATINKLESKGNNLAEYQTSLSKSLHKADEALNPGWRKLLDKVLNAIIKLFSKKHSNLSHTNQVSHSFFKKPNVLTDEVAKATQEIINKTPK